MFTGIYDGRRVTSLALSDEEWQEIRAHSHHENDSQLRSPFSGNPMGCVERNGLRYFRMHKHQPSGLTDSETEHHIRLKQQVYEAARKLGYEVELEYPAPDRSWIADVFIKRPDHPPVAVEIQWSKQNDDTFRMRTERYARAGVACLWLDANLDYGRVEKDCWGYDHETLPADGRTWSGILPVEGVMRLPVSRHTELVRYDGAWHTAGETVTDLLEGRLMLYRERLPETLDYLLLDCWKCHASFYAWRLGSADMWPKAGRPRKEERYADVVAAWSRQHHGGVPACRFADRYSRTVGQSYRAYCCPRCGALQGDFFLMMETPATERLSLPVGREVQVLHTDRVPSRDVAYPRSVPPSTFGNILKARGSGPATRRDEADWRMRLLGWEPYDILFPPDGGVVARVQEAARAMVAACPALADMGGWRSSRSAVSCGDVRFDLRSGQLVLPV